jgi:hypothetical protein
MIGTKGVLVEDDEFVHGYDDGYTVYHQYYHDEKVLNAYVLLMQLRNGWGDEAYVSDMHTTGFLVGWLAAFLEQEEGQLARCVALNGTDDGGDTDERDIESV